MSSRGPTTGTVAYFTVYVVHAETPPREDGGGVRSLLRESPSRAVDQTAVKERNAESTDECLRDRCLK